MQQLKKAAKDAGKDLSAFDKVFTSLEESASKGLVKGSKEANVAKMLGLSQDDLKNLNRDDLLKKALEGTKQFDRQKGESLLGDLVGGKNAGWLVGNRDNILSGDAPIVSNKDINTLFEFKNSLEDITDVVRAALIPALMSLVQWVTKAATGYIDKTKDLDAMDNEALGLAITKNRKTPGFAESMMAGADYQSDVIFESDKGEIEKAKKRYITRLYGEDIYNEVMKTHEAPASVTDELDKRRAARQKERDAEQARLAGPVNREAPVTKTEKAKSTLKGLDDLGGPSALKMGGLLGTDVNYRLQRVGEESLKVQRRMEEHLAKLAGQDSVDTPITAG